MGAQARPIVVLRPVRMAVSLLVAALLALASSEPAHAATPCPTSGPYSAAVAQTSGLAAYWRLGDPSGSSACDQRGTNPGTYSSSVALGQTGAVVGDADASATLNGTSANVSVPSATALNTGDAFTVEAWVKRGSTGGTASQVIAAKGSSWTFAFNTANKLFLQVGSKTPATSTITVADTTTWHHVVATKSGTSTRLYIDGADVTTVGTNATVASNTTALTIGSSGSTTWLKGSVDEVALYAGALTKEQVANHSLLARAACAPNSAYSQSIAGTTGVLGYWRLGESSGTTACDSAGKNPGSYSGGVTLGQPGTIAGDPGTAALFNGVSGAVSTPAVSSLNVGDTLTVEAWVKRTGTGGTANQVIASKQGTSWTLAFNTANRLVLQSGTATIATSTVPLTDTGGWHHVAASKSGASVRLYLDGADVTGTVTNSTLANSTAPLAIAQNANASWFNGAIDDVALYSTALTGAQISGHFSLGIAPVNTAPPTLAGSAVDGQTLTATSGTWSGRAPSYAYQWQSCDGGGAACQSISGATTASYTLKPSDVGARMRVMVTASNAGGSASSSSQPSATVAAVIPSNTSEPSIAGSATNGQVLTASPGTWSGTPGSFSYQWLRCDTAGAACSPIAGATATTRTLTDSDVAAKLRVSVTDTNAAGATTAVSPATATVADIAPRVTTNPTLSGGSSPPAQGETLTAAQGTFAGNVTSRSFQWQTCDAQGTGCTDVDGATGSTYSIRGSDLGLTVRVADIGSNAAGATRAYSSALGPVVSSAPRNTSPPTISGTPNEGTRLTSSGGSWTGSADTTTYQWLRCDSAGAACSAIASGGASDTYDVVNADHGHALRLSVTKANAFGSDTATSAPTSPATGSAPTVAQDPQISGGSTPPVEGETLSASGADFVGAVNTLARQWQRCDAGDPCVDIAGATGAAYTLTATDVGKRIRIVEVATNAAGSTIAPSASTAAVDSGIPVNTAAPAITGAPDDGEITNGRMLTATPGTWTSSPSFAYQWRRCNSEGSSCTPITGATNQSYLVTSSDVGSTLRVAVTATRPLGSTDATSDSTSVVVLAVPPSNTALPTIAGTARDAETLTASPGTWGGSKSTLAYQWRRCAADGTACSNIAGAGIATYEVMPEDVGKTLRVVVTATNAAGTTSATSAPTAVVDPLPAPTSSGPAEVSGNPEPGELLTVGTDNWSSTTHAKVSYQWQRCAEDDTGCEDIAGATNASYRSTVDDIGSQLQAKVQLTGSWSTAAIEMSQTTPLLTSKTLVTGAYDPDASLEIDPTNNPLFPSVDTFDITNQRNVAFIQSMPTDRQMSEITLGDIGPGGSCTTAPVVGLQIREHSTGDLREETAAPVRSTDNVTITSGLHRRTWHFPTTTLRAGRGYTIELLWPGSSSCGKLEVKTWPHNRRQVNPGPYKCSYVPDELQIRPGSFSPAVRRMWHVQGQNDVTSVTTANGATCYRPNQYQPKFDPSLPTGWLVMGADNGEDWTMLVHHVYNRAENPWQYCGHNDVRARGTREWFWRLHPGASDDDYVCTWRQFAKFGTTVPHGWYYALPWRTQHNGGPRDMYIKLSTPQDQQAVKFRPNVYFDSSEEWRPLDVARFLSESDAGYPAHFVCDAGECDALRSPDDLNIHPASTAYIDIDGDYRSRGEASYQTPYAECLGERRDCVDGPRSAFYYHKVGPSPGGYTYFDYWLFYRFNYFSDIDPGGIAHNHEGDWESVAIAPSLSNPDTFDFAIFSQHGHYFSYLRDTLSCDGGGEGSCGNGSSKYGTRVSVFPANGSHANYPETCDEDFGINCGQTNNGRPERGHDGEEAWLRNDDTDALLKFPTGGNDWVYWPGLWGNQDHGSGGKAPASPGLQQPHFSTPWGAECGDSSCPRERVGSVFQQPRLRTDAHRLAPRRAAKTFDRLATRCGSWFGAGVRALACSRREVRSRVRRGQLAPSRRMHFRERGRPLGAASAGLAQLIGEPLRRNRRIVLDGPIARDAAVFVRFASRGRLGIATFRASRRRRVAQVVIEMRRTSRGFVPTMAVGGARRGPSSVRWESG